MEAIKKAVELGLDPGLVVVMESLKLAMTNAVAMRRHKEDIDFAKAGQETTEELQNLLLPFRTRNLGKGLTKSDLRDFFVLVMRRAADIAEAAPITKPNMPEDN